MEEEETLNYVKECVEKAFGAMRQSLAVDLKQDLLDRMCKAALHQPFIDEIFHSIARCERELDLLITTLDKVNGWSRTCPEKCIELLDALKLLLNVKLETHS